jgi:hypothetical protein
MKMANGLTNGGFFKLQTTKKIKVVVCKCGKPYAVRNEDGIGWRIVPKHEPNCICEISVFSHEVEA